MLMASFLALPNAAEDKALASWKWPEGDQDSLVNTLAAYRAPADIPKAYTTLASFTYKGAVLPVKVGAGVIMKYLTKIS
jgi:hypothetical protein